MLAKAEDVSCKSDSHYQVLFETMNQGVIYFDANGIIFLANPSAQRILGLSLDQMLGKTVSYLRWKTIREDGTDFPDDQYPTTTVLRTGQPVSGVVMGICNPADNEHRWILIDSVPQFREDEMSPYQVYATFTDITERKRVEDALRENENRYRELLEAESDAIVLINKTTGNILDANSSMVSMYGYSHSELMTKTGIDLSAEMEETQQSISGIADVPNQFSHTPLRLHRKKDGSIFPVEINAHFFIMQGRPVITAAIRDITQRKQTEEALRKSEERFREILENSPDTSYKRDLLTNTYEYLSPAFTQISGYTPDEFINLSTETVLDLIHLDDQTRIEALITESMSATKGTPYQVDYRFKHKDGHYRWLHDQFILTRDAQGQLATMIGSVSDITDRKRTEEALSDQQWRLASIIEGTQAGTWEWNTQTGETVFNDRWAQILGYTLDELSPVNIKTWESLTHPDDLMQSDKLLERHFSGELANYEIEFRMKHKDGHWVWISDRGRIITRTADGKALMMFGTHFDITERKKVEDALLESEKKYRTLFDAIADSVFVIDQATGKILDVNSTATRTYGFSRDEFIKMDAKEVSAEPEATTKAIEHPESYVAIRYHCRKDGSVFPVELTASTFELESKTIFIATSREITERKQAEEALARAAARDHHIAGVLQQIVMPPQILIQPAGYDTAVNYHPASQEADVCGDFCDIFDLGEGNIGISLGDIVGKGLLAALRVTSAKNMIRSYAFLYNQPSKVMSLANDALCRAIAVENDMLTAFFAILDTRNGTLRYSNAGHEPPIVWRSDGQAESLRLGGPMFCGMGKQEYLQGQIIIQAEDIFVMVTDGITEAGIKKCSEHFGMEGIKRCLSAKAGATAGQIAAAILEDATRFADGTLHDDASIIVIKKDGNSHKPSSPLEEQWVNDEKNFTNDANELRQQAEECLKHLDVSDAHLGEVLDIQQVVSELQVHKIELEMQNDELRRAQFEVEAGLERYRNLYDFAPVAYFTLDREGIIRQLNLAAAELLGISKTRLMNEYLVGFVSPETQSSFNIFLTRMFECPARDKCKIVFLTGAKGKLCAQVEATVSENECRFAVVDITEDKKLEEKTLRESESRLLAAQRVAHIGSWELDILTHDLWWSDETFQIFGFQKGDFGSTMEAFFDCVHPDDKSLMNAVTQAAWYEKQPFDVEHRIILLDGTERIVHEIAETTFNDAGQPVRMTGTIQDITERKKSEKALQESESWMRDVLFSTADWVWEVDVNGVYTYTSQKGIDFFGRSAEDLIGKTPFDFMPPEEIARVAPIFSEIIANKAPIKDLENWNIKSNGERICHLTNGVPILDEKGNLKGYRGVDRDITYRKQIEEEKRRFYRDTIKSVTQGKLDLVSLDELTEYMDPACLISSIESPKDTAISRRKIMDFCKLSGLDKDGLELYESAVGEAITNAIKHANGCRMYAGVGDRSFWVTISDKGKGISSILLPNATLRRGFSSVVSMGMGYTIMMAGTDNIMLSTGPEGTTIVLSANTISSKHTLSLDDFPDTWDEIPDV